MHLIQGWFLVVLFLASAFGGMMTVAVAHTPGGQQDDYDLSCGLASEIHGIFVEGMPQCNGYYLAQHGVDVLKDCQYVVEIVSGDFAPVITIHLPDGGTLQDDNPAHEQRLRHDLFMKAAGRLEIHVTTWAAGDSGGYVLQVVPAINHKEPPADWFQPWQRIEEDHPEMKFIAQDTNATTLFDDLSQEDELFRDAPTDFYALPVEAGQHLSIRYGEADSSGLRAFQLFIYTPDGRQTQAEGERGAECKLDISEDGDLIIAATTYFIGGLYGAYYLQVLGLEEPLIDLIMTMTADDFLSLMQQRARPLTLGPSVSWGDPLQKRMPMVFAPKTFDPGYLEVKVFELVNQTRAKEGLPPLSYSDILNQSARQHSEEMGSLNYCSHISPIAANATSDLRIHQVFKFKGRKYAENIGIQTHEGTTALQGLTYDKLAADIMESWLNSSGHRRQILRTDLFFLGVGCALVIEGAKAEFYYTQNFGGR